LQQAACAEKRVALRDGCAVKHVADFVTENKQEKKLKNSNEKPLKPQAPQFIEWACGKDSLGLWLVAGWHTERVNSELLSFSTFRPFSAKLSGSWKAELENGFNILVTSAPLTQGVFTVGVLQFFAAKGARHAPPPQQLQPATATTAAPSLHCNPCCSPFPLQPNAAAHMPPRQKYSSSRCACVTTMATWPRPPIARHTRAPAQQQHKQQQHKQQQQQHKQQQQQHKQQQQQH